MVGLAGIVFPARMLGLIQSLMQPAAIRLLGAGELVLGAVMIVAALRRLVGLRTFVIVLGAWVVTAGMFAFAGPEFLIDMVNAVLLLRPRGFQLTVLWASGLLRIVLGGALIWAAAMPPQAASTPSVEHP